MRVLALEDLLSKEGPNGLDKVGGGEVTVVSTVRFARRTRRLAVDLLVWKTRRTFSSAPETNFQSCKFEMAFKSYP